MILYYSATGNTKYVAELLGEALDDETMDLLPRIRTGDSPAIHSDKPFVVCSPVYVCALAPFLTECIEATELTGSKEICFVFTDAGYGGMSESDAKKVVRKKGMIWRGCTEIKMPTNNVVSDMYPPTEEEECIRRIEAAKEKVKEIAKSIENGECLAMRKASVPERLLILPVNAWWIRYMQPSKPFYVTDKCIGCGKCEGLCPLNNIVLKDNKPTWISGCAHCMACICNCPTEAIEYGTITQTKVKYHIRKYLSMIS